MHFSILHVLAMKYSYLSKGFWLFYGTFALEGHNITSIHDGHPQLHPEC